MTGVSVGLMLSITCLFLVRKDSCKVWRISYPTVPLTEGNLLLQSEEMNLVTSHDAG